MAGRKPKKTSEDDWKRFDHFKAENEQLRKEVTKLRKIVKDTCVDSLSEKLKRQEKGLDPIKPLCECCGNDNLQNVDILRPDGAFSFSVCNSCGTRSQIKKKREVKKKEAIGE